MYMCTLLNVHVYSLYMYMYMYNTYIHYARTCTLHYTYILCTCTCTFHIFFVHDVIRDVERKKERKKERHLRQWKNENESCLRCTCTITLLMYHILHLLHVSFDLRCPQVLLLVK